MYKETPKLTWNDSFSGKVDGQTDGRGSAHTYFYLLNYSYLLVKKQYSEPNKLYQGMLRND